MFPKKKRVAELAFVVLCLIFFFAVWNSIISAKEDVELKKSQVEVALQRQYELLPNFVMTVKAYIEYEERVFSKIIEANIQLAKSVESGDVGLMAQADSDLKSAINSVLEIASNYPEFTSSQQFIALQDEIAGSQNRIAFARNLYNEAVYAFNVKITKFPNIIFTNSLVMKFTGIKAFDYFEADSEAKEPLTLSFAE